MNLIGIGGAHDVGGLSQFEQRLNIGDRQLDFWEIRVHALLVLLSIKSLITTDELRRGVESLESESYKQWGYYDKWSVSMTTILLERNIICSSEFEFELLGDEQRSNNDDSIPILFKAGDLVRIKKEDSRLRWRRPHIRVPGYIYGQVGKIEHYIGSFDDPFLKAFRGIGPKQPLYSVSFSLSSLWHSVGVVSSVIPMNNNHDILCTDVYQDWLEFENNSSNDNHLASQKVQHHDHQVRHHHFKELDSEHHSISNKNLIEEQHNHDHIHQNRYDVECIAIDNETKSINSTQGKIISEVLLKLLLQKNIISKDELQKTIESLENANMSMLGATLVAHAWKDINFKNRLLQDAQSAAAEVGIVTSNPNTPTVLEVVENVASSRSSALLESAAVPAVHNVVVCTLCSCYPTGLLGFSPSWYKSSSYRARVVREPRNVLAEFGTLLPSDTLLRIHDSTADCRYLVLPLPPQHLNENLIKELTIDELRKFVTRDSMIGVRIL